MPDPQNRKPFFSALLLAAALIFAFFCLTLPPPCLADDYAFRDEMGNDVKLPKDKPVYSRKNPGPWAADTALLHEPEVEWSMRKTGLESVRILKISFSHPVSEKEGQIQKVYLADKDGLIIGYKAFETDAKNFSAEFKINSVINYVRIYVECSKHGLWGNEMRF